MRAPLISASRQGLAKENQRKESEQNSRNSAKQMKTFLNFWKGLIRATDVILTQVPRPLKMLEWEI